MPITQEDLIKALSELRDVQKSPDRTIVIRTGSKGASVFHRTIRKTTLETSLRFAMVDKVIDSVEGKRLLEMLDSPDEESFELASMIITQLTTPVKFE